MLQNWHYFMKVRLKIILILFLSIDFKSMNASKIVAFFAGSLLLITSCKQESAASSGSETALNAKASVVKPTVASFQIEGMTCAIGCAKTIEKKLAETPGVQKAKVDFEKKQATVHFDADKLSTNQLKQFVESCADGKTYKVTAIKVSL